MLPRLMETGRASLKALIPDPAAYEKTLRPFEEVIKDKDQLGFKNYGGLAEAYFFAGDREKGQRLYDQFIAHSTEILGPEDNYRAGLEGDLGILYFNEKDYKTAEPFLLRAIKQLEDHLTPAISNNLIANYLCMTIIRDHENNKAEAGAYAKKLMDLVARQRQPLK